MDYTENTKKLIENMINNIINSSDKNTYEGMQIFDEAIFAYGNPKDELYKHFKETPEANLSELILPNEWMPECKTVVSVFLPFTEVVRKSNRNGEKCSIEWSIGRIEGQAFIENLLKTTVDYLNSNGIKTLAPLLDARFECIKAHGTNKDMEGLSFTSKWSERHNGFICGLGTFGLSKGLITKKGIAGRLMSFFIDKEVDYTKREYKGLYDYCIMCGLCAKNCPAHAIDIKEGKKHQPCCDILTKSSTYLNGRFGCGKCQVAVPCESCIPER